MNIGFRRPGRIVGLLGLAEKSLFSRCIFTSTSLRAQPRASAQRHDRYEWPSASGSGSTRGPAISSLDVANAFQQEIFLFEYDLSWGKYQSGMAKYARLRDVGGLSLRTVKIMCQGLHNSIRSAGASGQVEKSRAIAEVMPHVKQIVDDMCAGLIPLSTRGVIHLLSSARDAHQYDLGISMFERLRAVGEFVDSRPYGVILDLYVKTGRPFEEVEALFAEAIEKFSGASIHLYEGMCKAYISLGHPELAEEVLFQLRAEFGDYHQGADITFSQIAWAYEGRSDAEKALAFLLRGIRSNFVPTLAVVTAVMKLHSEKTMQISGAMELLREFQARGGKVAKNHINVLLKGLFSFSELDQLDEVLRQVRELLRSSPATPDTSTFNTIIVGLGRFKSLHHITEMLNEMALRKVEPTVITYSCLIKAYGSCKAWPMVMHAWDSLKQTYPDAIGENAWKTLATAASTCGQQQWVKEELMRLEAPTNISLSVLGAMANEDARTVEAARPGAAGSEVEPTQPKGADPVADPRIPESARRLLDRIRDSRAANPERRADNLEES